MDDVFKALADASRRRLLDSLNRRNGQSLRELCAGLDMTRQSVSKHLAILAEAGLVTTVWRGREKLHYLNAVPINEIAERWINQYDRARVHALSDLKRALEGTSAPGPAVVCTFYLHTTPERLWRALTDPADTRRYASGLAPSSDWKPGSTYELDLGRDGAVLADPEQIVLAAEPHRWLACTWHSFTPEWAAAFDVPEEVRARYAAERRSSVAFDMEPDGDQVRLTVTHDGFAAGSAVAEAVRAGWPRVLSDLKTLLESEAD